jgi:hypothetical protein
MKLEASTIAGGERADAAVGARRPAAPIAWAAGLSWPTAALALGYVALHLALDRLSFIGALHGIGITPWNPSAGLALALLILKGPRWAPLVLAAELGSEFTVPVVSVSAVSACLASLVVVAGYAGTAAILRRLGLRSGMRRSRDVVALLVVTILGSGLIAGGYVAIYAAAGVVPVAGFAEAGFYFWIGDTIGMVVLAPPLLLLSERIARTAPPDPRAIAYEQRGRKRILCATRLASFFWRWTAYPDEIARCQAPCVG